MTPTVDEVLAWDLSALPGVVAHLNVVADQLLDASAAAVRAATADPDWHGATHDTATMRVAAVGTSLRRTARGVHVGHDAVRARIGELTSIQQSLRERVWALGTEGFVLAPDGRVTHPDPDRRADALYLTTVVETVLDRAGRAEDTVVRLLAEATAAVDGSGADVTAPDGSVGSARTAAEALIGLEPAQSRAYWESLSDREREALIRGAPQIVGNLDGIPFEDRVVANRYTMVALLERERGRSEPDRELIARLESMLDDDRRFVAFHPGGDGRFVELVGEFTDDTENVGVFVPGTGTALDDVDALHRTATELSAASGAPILVWANATFPQAIADLPSRTPLRSQAINPQLAVEAAPRLAQFVEALDLEVAAAAPDAEVTAVGHSYGGTIVGTAEQHGMQVDRVVFASSAGMGAGGPVDRPEDVVRYSITAPGDDIHIAQEFGDSTHGADPDEAEGVIRLDSGFVGPPGHRELLAGPDAHSSYLSDPTSDAFGAIAEAIGGGEPPRYVERAPDIAGYSDAPGITRLGGRIAEELIITPLGELLSLFD